jgi:hypothetical protein
MTSPGRALCGSRCRSRCTRAERAWALRSVFEANAGALAASQRTLAELAELIVSHRYRLYAVTETGELQLVTVLAGTAENTWRSRRNRRPTGRRRAHDAIRVSPDFSHGNRAWPRTFSSIIRPNEQAVRQVMD